MTFRQLHQRFFEKIDKSAGGVFQPREVDRLLNEAVVEAVADWSDSTEKNEKARAVLIGLQRRTERGEGRTINLSAIAGYDRKLAIRASWDNDETGQPNWKGVAPLLSETAGYRATSWIHRASDTKPVYREFVESGRKVVEIQSVTDPRQWEVDYSAKPQLINGFTAGATEWTDFPAWAENVILEKARRKAIAELGDAQSYPIAAAEEQAAQ